MADETHQVKQGTGGVTDASAPTCGICLSPIAVEEAKSDCPSCAAGYHAECWEEVGGCAVYGCAHAPAVEHRQAIEIPVSYWGQERKPCPACGQEILAAAVRCRHCGVQFSSARPQDSNEFQRQSDLGKRLPALRRTVVILFILSLIPCAAPGAAIWLPIWYSNHREELQSLPSLYGALCKIAMVVAIGQTALMVLAGVFHSLSSN